MKRSIPSKFLAFLLALVMVISMLPVSVFAVGESATWSKVELKDINPTDTIAITMTTSDGTTYVLDNSKGTSSAPTAVVGTVSESTLTTTEVSSSTLGWNISSTEDGLVIYKAKAEADEADTWLYSTNLNNGVRVGTNDGKFWVLDEDTGYLNRRPFSPYFLSSHRDSTPVSLTIGTPLEKSSDFLKSPHAAVCFVFM